MPYYAELITFMELTPWNGPSVNKKDPEAPMRTATFGPRGEGMATYVIVENPNRVMVVKVLWVDWTWSREGRGVGL